MNQTEHLTPLISDFGTKISSEAKEKKVILCGISGCNRKMGYFNLENPEIVRCRKHKIKGMRYIHTPICCAKGCKIVPSFGFNYNRLFCAFHNAGDMPYFRNPKKHVIKPRIKREIEHICIVTDCNCKASFNYKGFEPLYCGLHANLDMLCLRNRFCLHTNCNNKPIYSIRRNVLPNYCHIHKKRCMVRYSVKLDFKVVVDLTRNYSSEEIDIATSLTLLDNC